MEKQIKTASIVFCGAQLGRGCIKNKAVLLEPLPPGRDRGWHSTPWEQQGAGWAAHAEPSFHQADALKVWWSHPLFCSVFPWHTPMSGLIHCNTSWTPLLQASASSWPSGIFSHSSPSFQYSTTLPGSLWHTQCTVPTLPGANSNSFGFPTSPVTECRTSLPSASDCESQIKIHPWT